MAQGPMAMAEPNFTPLGDEQNDDLPRTFRREKEARAREARERAAQERAAAPSLSSSPDGYGPAYSPAHGSAEVHGQVHGQAHVTNAPQPRVEVNPDYAPVIADMPYPASVRRFDVPFVHLVTFFLKAVLAAIPALILLTAILWVAGAALQGFFPDLVKMKVLISFPN